MRICRQYIILICVRGELNQTRLPSLVASQAKISSQQRRLQFWAASYEQEVHFLSTTCTFLSSFTLYMCASPPRNFFQSAASRSLAGLCI